MRSEGPSDTVASLSSIDMLKVDDVGSWPSSRYSTGYMSTSRFCTTYALRWCRQYGHGYMVANSLKNCLNAATSAVCSAAGLSHAISAVVCKKRHTAGPTK